MQSKGDDLSALGVGVQPITIGKWPETSTASSRYGQNVLCTINRKGSRVAMNATAGLERPQSFTGRIISCLNVAIRTTKEDQSTAS